MNDFLVIPEFQRRKAIPKPLKDIELIPFNKGLEVLMSPFLGDDDLRPVLKGIYFDSQDKSIVATNAHKLIKLKMPETVSEMVETGIYKTKANIEKEYRGIVKNAPSFATDMPFDKFFTENAKIDGTYPNYNAVIPDSSLSPETTFLKEIDLHKLYWFSEVMSNAKILDDEKINALKDPTEYQKGFIPYLKTEYGSFINSITHRVVVRFTIEGKKELMAFNGKFLADTIKALLYISDDRYRKFFIKNPSGAACFQVSGDSFLSKSDSVALLMPMAISSGYGDSSLAHSGYFKNEQTEKEYQIVYDLDENKIFSNGELYDIDESVGFVEQQAKSSKPTKTVEPIKQPEKVVFTAEFIRKRISALQIALRLAEKRENEQTTSVIEKGKRVVVIGGMYEGKEGLLTSSDVIDGNYLVQIDGKIVGVKDVELKLIKDSTEQKYVPNISFEDWLKLKNITYYKRSYYWVADDGGEDYMYSGEYKDVMKFLREEWKKYLELGNKK
jgi:hypothetical protein